MPYSVIRIRIGRTNRDSLFLLDLARRQADFAGRRGIASKRGQTNERYNDQGYIRLAHLTKGEARLIARRIADLGEPAIRVQRLRNPNRRRR